MNAYFNFAVRGSISIGKNETILSCERHFPKKLSICANIIFDKYVFNVQYNES